MKQMDYSAVREKVIINYAVTCRYDLRQVAVTAAARYYPVVCAFGPVAIAAAATFTDSNIPLQAIARKQL